MTCTSLVCHNRCTFSTKTTEAKIDSHLDLNWKILSDGRAAELNLRGLTLPTVGYL
ncbi:hypothetical protein bas28_0082 [Escherichia phage IrmaTschudi]|uniref:Uncharacterized protein n=2 Tax=Caudoviricetes TaxID=2731619 RepID=A0AAE7VTA5_9CAUD|nr:hypothetical protein vBSenS3_114 [Salmonella phage vB_SenS-3]QXV80435.1 hypothetical protein bas28_0082 [Escherichia phage IrmaTschudi]